MIELAEDGLETLNEVSAWELKISQIDLIEDAGEFSPDEDVAWAVCLEPLTDATKAGCALGYEECGNRCGTPHVCCDNYVEPTAAPWNLVFRKTS